MTTKWNKKRILRKLKTLFTLQSATELKVREATSNAPWIANEEMMAEISLATARSDKECVDVMKVVFGRLTDRGRNWRHVYKSLILLDYLVRTGPPLVLSESLCHIKVLYALKNFKYMDEDGRDQGMHIRSKSAALIALINRKGLPDVGSTDVLGSGPLQFPVGNVGISDRDAKEIDEGRREEGVDRIKTAVDELDPLSKFSSSKKSTETVLTHGGSQRRWDGRTRRHTVTAPEVTFDPHRSPASGVLSVSNEIRLGDSLDSRHLPVHNNSTSIAAVATPFQSLATTRGPRNTVPMTTKNTVDGVVPFDPNWMTPIISS